MIERHERVMAGTVGASIAAATGAKGGRVLPESTKAGIVAEFGVGPWVGQTD